MNLDPIILSLIVFVPLLGAALLCLVAFAIASRAVRTPVQVPDEVETGRPALRSE